jgi:alpha-ribazole phosphatase/probable phosphoglycerate mutase
MVAPHNRKRYLGWSDVDIDKTTLCEEKIQDLLSQNFDFVYSSDLKRCTQTLDKLGLSYSTDTRLRELKFKDKIELKSFDEIEKLPCFRQEHLESEISWFEYISDEDYKEFHSRIKSFLDTLDFNKNILICSHKGTLNTILELFGKEKQEFDYLQSYTLSPYNSPNGDGLE